MTWRPGACRGGGNEEALEGGSKQNAGVERGAAHWRGRTDTKDKVISHLGGVGLSGPVHQLC